MNKIEDIISATKLIEILQTRDDDKIKKTILWTLAIVGAVVAIAGIAYAVYRFFTPDYLEDFDEDFEDDFEEDYFEEEDEIYYAQRCVRGLSWALQTATVFCVIRNCAISYYTKKAPRGCAGARTMKMLLCNRTPRESLQANSLFFNKRVCNYSGVWLSLVERYVRDVEVACSNHVTPIEGAKVLGFTRVSALSFFIT